MQFVKTNCITFYVLDRQVRFSALYFRIFAYFGTKMTTVALKHVII
jgi:hypothetical protein